MQVVLKSICYYFFPDRDGMKTEGEEDNCYSEFYELKLEKIEDDGQKNFGTEGRPKTVRFGTVGLYVWAFDMRVHNQDDLSRIKVKEKIPSNVRKKGILKEQSKGKEMCTELISFTQDELQDIKNARQGTSMCRLWNKYKKKRYGGSGTKFGRRKFA